MYSINEYGIEAVNSKSTTLYNVVKGFLDDDVPVDAIGFQCHFPLGQVPPTLQANLQRFADLGLDVAITELDINLRGPPNATALEQQAKDYWSVVDACVNTGRCVSVVSRALPSCSALNSLTIVCRRFGGYPMIILGFRTGPFFLSML